MKPDDRPRSAVHAVWARLTRGSLVLTRAGLFHASLAVVALALMPFDDRTILGVDPWLKPFKFLGSLAVFEWTLAWYLSKYGGRTRSERVIAWGVALVMIGEVVPVCLQSARGTTSHFNEATDFDGLLFASMGILISINTVLVGWLFVLSFFRGRALPSAVRWGLRLGLAVFLVGSLQGVSMILRGAHTVGAPDGGAGLPLVNWSTQAGDLRVAHALGLHALQVFPLLGYALARWGRSAAWLGLALVAWLGVMLATHRSALQGQPLIRGEVATIEPGDLRRVDVATTPELPYGSIGTAAQRKP